MDTAAIRKTFLDFFAARDHRIVASSSLIPLDPSLMLTTAGMVQFKPYMVGEEAPPYPRAASVQKCARTTDIEKVGLTARHLTFFEMLGNFSLGDYFKNKAIPWAWELVTDGFGFDPDQLWVTVHVDDEEAAGIWIDAVGVAPERVQRLDADNFWSMGAAGPCGPCSEIFYDKGPAFGREGGPAVDDERHVEVWNLVFMQYLRDDAGNIVGDLPQRNIDTGAGLERLATVIGGHASVFEVDTIRPVIAVGERAAAVAYGDDAKADVSLRILAEHARSATFLITDGVFPSNEDRGYVLRRIIRRAVRHAWLLGIEAEVMPALADEVVGLLGGAYPELERSQDGTKDILAKEEGRFRQTLRSGLAQLDIAFDVLPEGEQLPGAVVFKLHDTFGFPVELTREISEERGVEVDAVGFEAEMDAQQRRARAARQDGQDATESDDAYRAVAAAGGPEEFLGYETTSDTATVVGIVADTRQVDSADAGTDVVVFCDRTPFYAEAGGQVGDTGVIVAGGARVDVRDTQSPRAGLIGHVGTVAEGTLHVGDTVALDVDAARRRGIRRHHTATHLLHWALREVLGAHVRQQGSLVEADRLRFDFSHFQPVTAAELRSIEDLANAEVMSAAPVANYETSKAEADAAGVVAFFGEKYGDRVRVLEAGPHSKELCGGTHVSNLGEIGPIVVVSESSIGSNLRRIEALAGPGAYTWLQDKRALLADSAAALHVPADEVPQAVEKRLGDLTAALKGLDAARAELASSAAAELVSGAFGLPGGGSGLVLRHDGAGNPKELQRLATELRQKLRPAAVVLGADLSGKASLVGAVSKELQQRGLSAADLVRPAAAVVGGGTGKNTDVAMAGGRDGSRIDAALAAAREALDAWEG